MAVRDNSLFGPFSASLRLLTFFVLLNFTPTPFIQVVEAMALVAEAEAVEVTVADMTMVRPQNEAATKRVTFNSISNAVLALSLDFPPTRPFFASLPSLVRR